MLNMHYNLLISKLAPLVSNDELVKFKRHQYICDQIYNLKFVATENIIFGGIFILFDDGIPVYVSIFDAGKFDEIINTYRIILRGDWEHPIDVDFLDLAYFREIWRDYTRKIDEEDIEHDYILSRERNFLLIEMDNLTEMHFWRAAINKALAPYCSIPCYFDRENDFGIISKIENIEDTNQLLELVNMDGNNIRFIEKLTNLIIQKALFNTPWSLKYLLEKDIEIPREFILEAINSDGSVLQIIENPDREIIETALKNVGYAIQFVPEPDIELRKIAIETHPKSIFLIENPSYEEKILAVEKMPAIIRDFKFEETAEDLELILLAIRNDPILFRFMGQLSDDFRTLIVERDPFLHLDGLRNNDEDLLNIEDYKEIIIIRLLRIIKEDQSYRKVRIYINQLKKLKPEWTEIQAMVRSMEAEDKVLESRDN